MQEWQLGAYQLVRRLGEGGMAQVYLARDVRLGREVAVKVLDRRLAERSGFRERFLREARVAAALDHPNIVPLFDFGEEQGILYLVMPYVSGGSLQDLLTRIPLPGSEVVSYGTQLADALAYAHRRNLVHRDVKPANILIHADGRLMLSDFGLAKILDGGARPAASRGQPDAGTPEYMAPEQIEGRTEPRSDIYGLGVVLYLLLTGQLPFVGSSSTAVMEGHLYRLAEAPRRINPEVTPAIEAVVMRALAKHPDDRYSDASEFGAALLAALVAGDAAPLPFVLPSQSVPPVSQPPSGKVEVSALPVSPVPPPRSRPASVVPPAVALSAGTLPALDTPLTSLDPSLAGPRSAQSGARPHSFINRVDGGSGVAPGMVSDVVPGITSGVRSHSTSRFSSGVGPLSPAISHLTAPPAQRGMLSPNGPFSVAPAQPSLPLARATQPPAAQAPLSTPLAVAAHDAEAPERRSRIWTVIVVLLLVLLMVAAGIVLQWVRTGATLPF